MLQQEQKEKGIVIISSADNLLMLCEKPNQICMLFIYCLDVNFPGLMD